MRDTRKFSLRLAAVLLFGLATSGHAMAQSCRAEAGEEDAQIFVDQCLEVSPATRPPCNADNPCQMMWDEIARGCAMIGDSRPDFCLDYGG